MPPKQKNVTTIILTGDKVAKPGEPHLINKGDSISIMTKIFASTTTYWQYFSPSLWSWKNQSNDK